MQRLSSSTHRNPYPNKSARDLILHIQNRNTFKNQFFHYRHIHKKQHFPSPNHRIFTNPRLRRKRGAQIDWFFLLNTSMSMVKIENHVKFYLQKDFFKLKSGFWTAGIPPPAFTLGGNSRENKIELRNSNCFDSFFSNTKLPYSLFVNKASILNFWTIPGPDRVCAAAVQRALCCDS